MDHKAEQNNSCSYREGALMPCSPLAMAYVPSQDGTEPAYDTNQALVRGTLFPGLDLPFMNVVNKGNLTGTALGELMALDFVIKELNLYLDTHKDDTEAFAMLKKMISLYDEGRERYIRKYGPITVRDLKYAEHFSWLQSPWPWEYQDGMED